MKLSKRLFTISELIPPHVNVFDIGCDHAYLSIYLTIHNFNNCYAVDLDIDKALKNIDEFKLNGKINIIKSNGLDNLIIQKEDLLILSGLGTKTIMKILSRNNEKLPDMMIIQSNNDIELLRKKVSLLGYFIEDERYIKENKRHYIIIKFKKGIKKYNKRDYLCGPVLCKNKEYIKDLYKYHLSLLKKVPIRKKGSILIKLILLKTN